MKERNASGGPRWVLINIAQALFLAFWTVVCSSLAVVTSIFSREFALWLPRKMWAPPLLRYALADVRAEGGHDVDPKAGCLFVMNHESMLDITVAFATIPRNFRFVAKRELAFVPFVGFYMWRVGMVFVNRKDPRGAYEALRRAAAQLRRGDCFLAYPEGTRSEDGRVHAFKRGPFLTAVQAQVPVVPVAIDGSGRVLPRDGFRLRPGIVRVKIGAPIPTAGMTSDDVPELIRRTRGALIDMHVAIGGLGGADEAPARGQKQDPKWIESRPSASA